MISSEFLKGASLGCIACLAACAVQPIDEEASSTSLRYEVPQTEVVPGGFPDENLQISEQGYLTFKAKPIALDDLDQVNTISHGQNHSTLGISVAGQARFSAVFATFQSIAARDAFEIINSDDFIPFDAASESAAASLVAPTTVGNIVDSSISVLVGYSNNEEACIVVLNGTPVGSEQLYHMSFQRLDSLVVRLGGADKILANSDIYESLAAQLRAEPGTPWKCVGGAMRQVSAAGWPFIDLEVIAD